MKKIIALTLAFVMALSFTACGGEKKNDEIKDDALTVLTNIWGKYSEDDKFPAAGGELSEGNMTDGAPGAFPIENAESLEAQLVFPAGEISKISSAASLTHMMNANTFTAGAFAVKDEDEVDNICEAVKNKVLNNQWMCGFPEKLVIMEIGGNLISAFGNGEIIDAFVTNAKAAYPSAVILAQEPIA